MNHLGRLLFRVHLPLSTLRKVPTSQLLSNTCHAYSNVTPARVGFLEGASWNSGFWSLHTTCRAASSGWELWPSAGFAPQGLVWRGLATQNQPQSKSSKTAKEQVNSLEITDESFSAITDQIPQKPVTFVEGTSYSFIILAAFAALGFFVYHFVTGFILEGIEYKCFDHAVNKLKTDPRITVRLGDDIRAWGSSSGSRVARQQIQHDKYQDQNGVEHVRLVFHLGGPGGVATVYANMYQEDGSWKYTYLLADVQSRATGQVQRLEIVPMH